MISNKEMGMHNTLVAWTLMMLFAKIFKILIFLVKENKKIFENNKNTPLVEMKL
jgi:hypothetical protein